MKKILMLVANGVEPMEMAAFTDVLGWASLVGSEEVMLIDAGFHKNIKTTFGLNLTLNNLVENINLNEFDALAIPGGFEPAGFYDDALSEPFLDVIRYFHNHDKNIASVCVSSLALGAAGVLEGKRATIYHQKNGIRKQQLEDNGAIFVDEALVCDDNKITSTGPGTAIEVAFNLLERLTSKSNAENVRHKMRIAPANENWLRTPQVPVIE
ncbi:MAG: DJ-1/PfpI family protein [Bermanella sp.]